MYRKLISPPTRKTHILGPEAAAQVRRLPGPSKFRAHSIRASLLVTRDWAVRFCLSRVPQLESPACPGLTGRLRDKPSPPARLSSAWASSTPAAGCSTLVVRSMAFRAESTSVAEPGRSDRFLAKRRIIKASRGRGQPALCQVGATGGVLMCWPMMATASSPRNGGLPVTIS